MIENSPETLRRTPLFDLHRELGGKMVPFAGYEMPVHYPAGILKEHLHTRQQAGLFDVSHMGQRFLIGPDHATTVRALEAMTPGDFESLGLGRMRYSLLLKSYTNTSPSRRTPGVGLCGSNRPSCMRCHTSMPRVKTSASAMRRR